METEQSKAKRLAVLLNAFADGNGLQFLADNNRWIDYCCPIGDIAEEFLTIKDIQIRVKEVNSDMVNRISTNRPIARELATLLNGFADEKQLQGYYSYQSIWKDIKPNLDILFYCWQNDYPIRIKPGK